MARIPIKVRLQKKAVAAKFIVPVTQVPEQKQLICATAWMSNGQPKVAMHYAD